MQAVILAAGKSSRFYPFTDIGHKSLIKIMGRPIIEHTLIALKKGNIKDIIIVVAKESPIKKLIGDGGHLGLSINYVVQEEALGMGNALLLAEKHIRGDFLLLHGHHVDINLFIKDVINAKTKDVKTVLLAEQRDDTWKYGVLKISADRVVNIVEKPEKGQEPSKLCVVGIYLFPKIFLKTLGETPMEHYQLEKAIGKFAKDQYVRIVEAKEKTVTLKYAWDILGIKDYLFKNLKKNISPKSKIAKSAEIKNNVVVEEGVVVMEGARIKGPSYLSKNAYVGTNSILRNGVDVGERAVIGANMEVKNSLIMEGSTTHSGYIGDSIIGRDCKIGGFFISANVRLDRQTVKTKIGEKDIDTGLRSLGVVMGDNTRVGIRVSTMPGVIVGNNVTIGPSTTIARDIDDNTKYYTKFKEIAEIKNRQSENKSQNKKLVILDIDYTLFDSGSYRHKFFKDIALILKREKNIKNGEELCSRIYMRLYNPGRMKMGNFSPAKFTDEVIKKTGISKSFREKIMDKIFSKQSLKNNMYNEVGQALLSLEKLATLGIFSQGDFLLQKAKIEEIRHLFHFDHIHIVKNKLDTLGKTFGRYKGYKVFLIDDALSVLFEVKKLYKDVFTIWVKRGRWAEKQKEIAGFSPDATILNLREAEEIVRNN